MRKTVSLVSLLALSSALPVAAGVLMAAPAGAATCQAGDTVLVESTWTPNPVVRSSTPFENDVTLTNCTNTSQTVSYGGTVTAPAICGFPPFTFGPISKTLSANQVATYAQPVDPAPNCAGTYSQYVYVKNPGGTVLNSVTVTFTVT